MCRIFRNNILAMRNYRGLPGTCLCQSFNICMRVNPWKTGRLSAFRTSIYHVMVRKKCPLTKGGSLPGFREDCIPGVLWVA